MDIEAKNLFRSADGKFNIGKFILGVLVLSATYFVISYFIKITYNASIPEMFPRLGQISQKAAFGLYALLGLLFSKLKV